MRHHHAYLTNQFRLKLGEALLNVTADRGGRPKILVFKGLDWQITLNTICMYEIGHSRYFLRLDCSNIKIIGASFVKLHIK